jgi:hypothetical protein
LNADILSAASGESQMNRRKLLVAFSSDALTEALPIFPQRHPAKHSRIAISLSLQR